MIKEIPVLKSGQAWSALCAPVMAMARAINGLRKLEFRLGQDNDWHFHWEDGSAVIEYPPLGGGGGNALGPVVFNGVANGQPCYFLMNSDGVAYSQIPTDANGNPYPIANPQ